LQIGQTKISSNSCGIPMRLSIPIFNPPFPRERSLYQSASNTSNQLLRRIPTQRQ
jgi:hypothetical protein